ncbi:MAG: tRNA 5-methoxyuridine(34)/uridine 5-oxyacetic acid(34) synthase CmoB [Pseudomonadota bacterium]|nr:MAG: tRNA 5-methoxyuridine(34)/uridine 5-oxyacetic acid(34) synthase CmoB [Pseudomonadota bacterium]
MIDYSALFDAMEPAPLRRWCAELPARIEDAFSERAHGDLPRWRALLEKLPDLLPSSLELDSGTVRIGAPSDCDGTTCGKLEQLLRGLHPWRKGPFEVFGVYIDAEWRSDWKWARLCEYIQPLAGRRVLDVGCGNGYYCWRMAGAGASLVIGIDPTQLYVAQFAALRRYAPASPVWVLPLGIEALPRGTAAFDTVFSMGVLYHRRSAQEHLRDLHRLLREGGELVLETLVFEGGSGEILEPPGRYAKMRNVWAIPACATLQAWIEDSGFDVVRVVDVTPTTVQEQRRTDWMHFESLADFLDPANPNLTVEGLPAPTRATVLAVKP